jgi:hypothetical protein
MNVVFAKTTSPIPRNQANAPGKNRTCANGGGRAFVYSFAAVVR